MKITIEVDDELIRNLLNCAFEGGSNYWYMIERVRFPKGFTEADYKKGGKAHIEKKHWDWPHIVPFQKGGYLAIRTRENDEVRGKKEWKLDRKALLDGLRVMAVKFPEHFGDFISGNEDAITGDVFLQCCLFGDAVFG